MKRLPLSLDVVGKTCLVVGGGQVATRKVQSLLECGARPRVVTPQFSAALEALLPRLEYSLRTFQDDDCNNCGLVFACTNNATVNRAVHAAARRRGVWCNLADDAAAGDFHVMATVRRHEICIGISTGGGSPALARHLKLQVEKSIGDEYATLLEMMSQRRAALQQLVAGQAARAAFWDEVLRSGVLDLLREGDAAAAAQLLDKLQDEFVQTRAAASSS